MNYRFFVDVLAMFTVDFRSFASLTTKFFELFVQDF